MPYNSTERVPLALPVQNHPTSEIANQHWQSQWHTSESLRQRREHLADLVFDVVVVFQRSANLEPQQFSITLTKS